MAAVSVKNNIIANVAGNAWLALMSVAFVPLYIRLMGVEAYGIVGVLVSLQAMFALLDFGLSQTLNRELARLSINSDNDTLIADISRTFEVIYWILALGVAASIALLSHSISYYWLNPETLARQSVRDAIWIMALVVGLRWPVALYIGGLNGLQRQISVNILLGFFATVQGIGALAVLFFVSPTVHAFLMWQALIALFQAAIFKFALMYRLPKKRFGSFRIEVLKRTWRFAAGITGVSCLATLLTQLDKVLLSKMLSLTEFGYYVFAVTVAAALYRLINPISTAYTPRLTELVSRNDKPELVRTYHQGCQVMAVTVLTTALTLAVFSEDILTLWTRNSALVGSTHLLVSLLVIGNALNGLLTVPYTLQLAHGWTRLSLGLNFSAVLILVPGMYFAALHWAAIGAALVWVVLNGGYLLIGMHLMHRRLLTTEKWIWYISDVGKPLVAVLVVVVSARLLVDDDWGTVPRLMTLIVAFVLAAFAALLSAQSLRLHFPLPLFWRTR